MKNRNDIACRIEKNRRALLRLVGFWLMLALWSNKARHIVPAWLGRFIHSKICKAEAAAGYLIEAAQFIHGFALKDSASFLAAANKHRHCLDDRLGDQTLCLEMALNRLKAIRSILRQLANFTRTGNRAFVRCPIALSAKYLIHFSDISRKFASKRAARQFLPP